jgi:ubiquinone/menaquinone biosynthesis C-methylase UbiE
MEFKNDIAIIQQLATQTNVGVLRRQAILSELNIQKGQTIIDIGCGGGHLLKEMSLAVGEKGKIIGVDTSQFQIKSAEKLCSDLSNVELLCCNADNTMIDPKSCDAVTSAQTLEYIEDIDDVLREMKKLQKQNSRFVNISTLWDFFGFHGPDPELNKIMHDSMKGQKHPMLPVELSGKLEKLGYKNIKTQEINFFIRNKNDNSFPKYHEILMSNAARNKGVSEKHILDWQNQLESAEREGNFAFTAYSVLTSAYN